MNKIEKIGLYIVTILLMAVFVMAANGVFDNTNYNNYNLTNITNVETDTVDTGNGELELYDILGDFATTAPLTGAGSNVLYGTDGNKFTLAITQATTSTDGYLSSTDWNTFNSAAGGGISDGDNVSFDIINVTGSISTFSPNLPSPGVCPNRTLYSTADVNSGDVVIGAGDSLQDAICDVPFFLNHYYRIRISTSYDGEEDIFIPQIISQASEDYDGGQLSIGGWFGEYPEVGSIFIAGAQGQANPLFTWMNITGDSPYYTGHCQVCIFGTQEAELYEMVFNDQTGTAVYGVTIYGSLAKVSDVHFEGEPDYAIETKQFGSVIVSNLTGSVDKNVFYASQGDIYIDHPYSEITPGAGYERYLAPLGLIYEQVDTSWPYQNNTLWGPDRVCFGDDDDTCPQTIYGNTSCVIIEGDTTTLEIC